MGWGIKMRERAAAAIETSVAEDRGDRPAGSWAIPTLILSFAVAAFLTVVWFTRSGPGLTIDSSRYVAAARNMPGSLGVSPKLGMRDVRYPPLMPAVLSIAKLWDGDVQTWSRWLNASLMFINVLLMGGVLLASRQAGNGFGVWCIAIFAVASDVLILHCFVWSEPLYLSFMLLMTLALVRYCSSAHAWKPLALAAACASLGLLTRYAGAALVLGGMATILLVARSAPRARIGHAICFALAAAMLPALWILSNLLLTNTATGREPSFASPAAELPRLGMTILNWWAPAGLSKVARFAIIGGLCSTGAAAALMMHRTRKPRRSDAPDTPPLLAISGILSVTYLCFLLISRSLFDHQTPFDWRILSPLFVTGLFFTASAFGRFWNHVPIRSVRVSLVSACVIVAIGHLANTVSVGQRVQGQGLGWNRDRFEDPALLSAIAELGPRVTLYSNDAAALAANLGRPVLPIPNTSRGNTKDLIKTRTFVRDGVTKETWVLFFSVKSHVADAALKRVREVAEFEARASGSKWTLYKLRPLIDATQIPHKGPQQSGRPTKRRRPSPAVATRPN